MPAFNNVYGHIVTSNGFESALQAVMRLVGKGRVWVCKSQYDGAETLHFDSAIADFASTPIENGRHLLNGGVEGPLADVIAFVRSLSECLAGACIEHGFEVYDADRNLVETFPR